MTDPDDSYDDMWDGSRRGYRSILNPDAERVIRLAVQERLLFESSGGRQGRLISAARLSEYIRNKGLGEYSSSTINAWIAKAYKRRSLAQP